MVSRTGTSFEERVGQVLVEGGSVTAEQIQDGRDKAQEKGEGLLDTLWLWAWFPERPWSPFSASSFAFPSSI